MTDTEFLELIGDPQQFSRDMDTFRRNAAVLSSGGENLIERYPDQWVAVYGGAVQASAESLDGLLARMDAQDIPRSDAIVRLIEREPPTMILAGC